MKNLRIPIAIMILYIGLFIVGSMLENAIMARIFFVSMVFQLPYISYKVYKIEKALYEEMIKDVQDYWDEL